MKAQKAEMCSMESTQKIFLCLKKSFTSIVIPIAAAIFGGVVAIWATDMQIDFQRDLRSKQCLVFKEFLLEDIRLFKRNLGAIEIAINREVPKDVVGRMEQLEPVNFLLNNNSEYLDCLAVEQAKHLSKINHDIVEYNEFLLLNKISIDNPAQSQLPIFKEGMKIISELNNNADEAILSFSQ